MQKRILLSCLLLATVLLSACKDSFETIRRDPDARVRLTKAMEYYGSGDYQKAQYLLEDLIPLLKNDSTGERVFFLYSYCHYNLKSFTFASYYFKQHYSTYTNGKFAEEALFMSAMSNFQLSANYRLDMTDTEKAIEGFQLFANSYPTSIRVAECNRMIDVLRQKLEFKAYEAAYLYFRLSDYKAASHSFSILLRDYPDSPDDEKIRYMLLKSHFRLSQNSIDEKKKERYNETIKYYYDFIDRYPKSAYAQEAQTIFVACQDALKKSIQ